MLALAAVLAPKAGEGFALSVRDYEDSLKDPGVKNVERSVRCEVDPQVERATTAESVPARIVLTLNPGTAHEFFVSAPKGSPSRPFTRADHTVRFHSELQRRWPQTHRDEIVGSRATFGPCPTWSNSSGCSPDQGGLRLYLIIIRIPATVFAEKGYRRHMAIRPTSHSTAKKQEPEASPGQFEDVDRSLCENGDCRRNGLRRPP